MKTIHRHHPPTTPAPEVATNEAGPGAASGQLLRRDPVWRVVGGSIAAGFVGAIVLTVGVFGGAPEHVIAGSALLAFAAGWAMLAVLSDRYTYRPQHWARVPAAAMALCGLGLLIGRPDDHTLNNFGWVWPPFALALAVWLFIRVRRGLAGRVRWLLYPVVVSRALGAAGAMSETAATANDQASYPAPGTLYNVGVGKRRRRWRFLNVGATFATTFFILTSILFAYFVNNFASYNKLYGSLGTLMVLLIWLNFNCMIVLMGFELNMSIRKAKRSIPRPVPVAPPIINKFKE